MTWDLGLQGISVLLAMALASGAVATLTSGNGLRHRIHTGIATAVACSAIGVFTSAVWFGWATEEDLQPNIDGVSFDEVLLSVLVTTAVAITIARRIAHRPAKTPKHLPGHARSV